ncbi:uncharacterized protein isoform X2 [Choristoneura fumiferana]
MSLTAAEKQRRYRERLRVNNPEKFEEFKRKNVERNRNRNRKLIRDCTEEEKEIIRKQWRNRKREILKKQWKNAREAQTSTDQSVKLNERYQIWTRPKSTSLRPHLEFAKTDSDTIDVEEVVPAHSTKITLNNTAKSQLNDLSQSQNDTTHGQRKSIFDQAGSQDKVINLTDLDRYEDDIDLLFKSYAKKLKTMTKRRQATVKFEIAKLMLKAELEECDEMQSLDNGQILENNMVMIIEQPVNSAGSETNDTFIKSSPSPVFENVDPFSTSPPITS